MGEDQETASLGQQKEKRILTGLWEGIIPTHRRSPPTEGGPSERIFPFPKDTHRPNGVDRYVCCAGLQLDRIPRVHIPSERQGPDRRMCLDDIALGCAVELSLLHVRVRREAGQGGRMVARWTWEGGGGRGRTREGGSPSEPGQRGSAGVHGRGRGVTITGDGGILWGWGRGL